MEAAEKQLGRLDYREIRPIGVAGDVANHRGLFRSLSKHEVCLRIRSDKGMAVRKEPLVCHIDGNEAEGTGSTLNHALDLAIADAQESTRQKPLPPKASTLQMPQAYSSAKLLATQSDCQPQEAEGDGVR
jgi:hypothetical protein